MGGWVGGWVGYVGGYMGGWVHALHDSTSHTSMFSSSSAPLVTSRASSISVAVSVAMPSPIGRVRRVKRPTTLTSQQRWVASTRAVLGGRQSGSDARGGLRAQGCGAQGACGDGSRLGGRQRRAGPPRWCCRVSTDEWRRSRPRRSRCGGAAKVRPKSRLRESVSSAEKRRPLERAQNEVHFSSEMGSNLHMGSAETKRGDSKLVFSISRTPGEGISILSSRVGRKWSGKGNSVPS